MGDVTISAPGEEGIPVAGQFPTSTLRPMPMTFPTDGLLSVSFARDARGYRAKCPVHAPQHADAGAADLCPSTRRFSSASCCDYRPARWARYCARDVGSAGQRHDGESPCARSSGRRLPMPSRSSALLLPTCYAVLLPTSIVHVNGTANKIPTLSVTIRNAENYAGGSLAIAI